MTDQADALMGIFGFKRVEEKAMDKVSETRRGLFNSALELRQIDRDRSGLDALTRWEVSQMWWAFNAALDAVEIELPEPHSTNGGDCVIDHFDCIAAIESTNLGLRIK